ncbi:MAG: hypothetical protein ACK4TF_00980 [Thermodesulfovibrionales bacterium]
MKRINVIAGILLILSFVLSGIAISEDLISIKGKVKTIDLKTNTVVITTQDGQEVSVTVEDETTLAKFKDGRISEGDEVKVKYIIKDGKNISTYFKKAAGC